MDQLGLIGREKELFVNDIKNHQKDLERIVNKSKNRKLKLNKVINIGKKLLNIISIIHNNNIIHRDIKPENIMLTKKGVVKVQIKVDRNGKVVEAIPGAKGSTTLDSYLLKVAKRAALSSKFDSNGDAPVYQLGTITYIFDVK